MFCQRFVDTVCCRRFYQGRWFDWDHMNPQTSCCCWFRAGVQGLRDLQWGSFQHMKLCWLTFSTVLGGSLTLTSAQFSLEESRIISLIRTLWERTEKRERERITFIVLKRQIPINKCKQAAASLQQIYGHVSGSLVKIYIKFNWLNVKSPWRVSLPQN